MNLFGVWMFGFVCGFGVVAMLLTDALRPIFRSSIRRENEE